MHEARPAVNLKILSIPVFSMSPLAKAGIVVGGYVAAFLLAVGVVWIYITMTDGPDREASGGMYAFGDSLLFCAAFGIVSIVPTGLMLIVLRQSRSFWVALSVLALAIAGTSVAMAVGTVLAPTSTSLWVMLSFPRIFLSPFLAVAFGLSALVAPERETRWCLLAAAAMETGSSIFGFVHWFVPLILQRSG
jgi:hypothetical protein